MAQSTSDQQRFLLDDRVVTQVRYALTLGRAVEQDAAARQRSAIEQADLRFYRGRKEVAAFAGLSAAEVDTLVGQENRLKMEHGIGRGKRNQAAHAIAGKLERDELIPAQTASTGLDAKARPQVPVNTAMSDRHVQEGVPVTPAPPVRAADEVGYQIKHYDELGPVVREQADLKTALEAFRRSDPASMPAILRDQAVLIDRDPDNGEIRFEDEAVRTAYAQHAQEEGSAKRQFPARDEPAAPAAISAMSPADRERLSAVVTRMQAALDQPEARSFTETANWVRQDAEALQAIAVERKHLATMVMATAARRHPEYRAALSRQYPDGAIQVENDIHAAELDERLAQLTRDPGAQTRGASQPRLDRQPETERNSIERDDERVQQSSHAEAVGPRARPMRGVGQQVDLDNFKKPKSPTAETVATNAPETGNKPTQRIPREIEDAYLRVGNKFHYTQKPTLQAFEDKGTRLETRSNSARIASDLVKIAGAREWGSIRVKGSDEFRQKVWLEATLQGIAVKGYKPSEVDLAQLAQRDRLAVANSVERDAARAQAQMTRNPDADRSGKERSQSASDKARLSGTLLEHGKANFNFDQAEPLNYYVKYRDASGKERTNWGVGLESALKDSQARIGQHIELKNLGKQPVSVSANLRDDDGKVVGKQTLEAHRNQWEIKADSFRSEEPKQAIKAHPDLVGAYAILRAAQVVADQNFQSREDRERFMTLAKETLARQMAERQGVPAVRVREQTSESRLEHGKERSIGR